MSFNRKVQRQKRHLRLRQRIIGTAERPRMSICITNKNMYVQFIDDDALGNFHGLARALINDMVIGVSAGYTKQLSIEGTGFKAVLKGKELALSLGFASPKIFTIPEGLTVTHIQHAPAWR